jgi:fumarate hydratase class II
MAERKHRIERDALGELSIPADALWSAQTQRAVDNFHLSGRPMPAGFIHALGRVKWAAARVNARLGGFDPAAAGAIAEAALEVAQGRHDDQFPVDVFQTGSGTSTNMNANEVIAALAARRLGRPVHPNDDVNRGQSSNDTVPTAIHVAAALGLARRVRPALEELAVAIAGCIDRHGQLVKTGRTHLMDAVPLTLGQEFGAWRSQVLQAVARLDSVMPRLLGLAQGGTAVGTGLNAPAGFGEAVAAELAADTGLPFTVAADRFAAIAAQDTAVELSAQLRGAALVLAKIAGDLRWMNSGPLAGLGEVRLPELQPGSSIMPGKVNPVIPEAVEMAAAAVIGNDATVALAGQSGRFQLNTMLPLIADRLLDSEQLVAAAAESLARRALDGLEVDAARLEAALSRNPMLVTALNPLIGYDRAAEIAKRARAEDRPILDVAVEMTGRPRDELAALLDPARLAGGTAGEERRG